MNLETIFKHTLSVILTSVILLQTAEAQGTSGQSNTQARPFPTTNYYRSPYARPPGYKPGEYAARAYARQQAEEQEQKQPQRDQSRQQYQRELQQVLSGTGFKTPSSATKNGKEKGYSYQDTVSVDGMNRTFQVHLPIGYRTLKNMPVVMVFHGLQLNGSIMMFLSNMNSVADRNGFIVMYGDGVGKAWEDGRGSHGHDDVGYVCKVLDKIATTVSIDRRRVYASGISNGGYFTQLLACAIPDRIAAVAVVAATMMQQAGSHCHSNRTMPIMFFLGTNDPLISWGSAGAGTTSAELGELAELVGVSKIGGVDSAMARFGGIMPVPEVMEFWAAHNHCSSANPSISMEPDRDSKDGTRVKKESWGSGSSEVVLYRIEGGGHTWPGGMPYASQAFAGRVSRDIDASETMWQFFKNKSR